MLFGARKNCIGIIIANCVCVSLQSAAAGLPGSVFGSEVKVEGEMGKVLPLTGTPFILCIYTSHILSNSPRVSYFLP